MREMPLEAKLRIRQRLERLADPVHLLIFPHPACPHCDELARGLGELSELSTRIRVEVVDVESKPLLAASYGIEMTPAIAILRGGVVIGDTFIRYYGAPDEAALDDLVDDLVGVSLGVVELAATTTAWLESLDRRVHVHAFVASSATPRPAAIHATHRLAIASPLISVDVIVAEDYPDLARQFAVTAVPSVVVAEHAVMPGDVSEEHLVIALQAAAATASQLV